MQQGVRLIDTKKQQHVSCTVFLVGMLFSCILSVALSCAMMMPMISSSQIPNGMLRASPDGSGVEIVGVLTIVDDSDGSTGRRLADGTVGAKQPPGLRFVSGPSRIERMKLTALGMLVKDDNGTARVSVDATGATVSDANGQPRVQLSDSEGVAVRDAKDAWRGRKALPFALSITAVSIKKSMGQTAFSTIYGSTESVKLKMT